MIFCLLKIFLHHLETECTVYALFIVHLVILAEGNGQLGKKKLYVPRVEDKNSNMQMLHISRIDDLIANSMNILEPAPVDADGNEREDGTFLLHLPHSFHDVGYFLSSPIQHRKPSLCSGWICCILQFA